jgi:hypothetical protein
MVEDDIEIIEVDLKIMEDDIDIIDDDQKWLECQITNRIAVMYKSIWASSVQSSRLSNVCPIRLSVPYNKTIGKSMQI